MTGSSLVGARMIAVCLLGLFLFNYPLLSLFSRLELVWGIPLLYFYLFAGWALVIVCLAVIMERR